MSLTPVLTVDLAAIAANWRALDALGGPGCETAAVVKADGYGCGAVPVARALARAGARTFFVATLPEAETLREALGEGPLIYVLGGIVEEPGRMAAAAARDIRPVLNSAEQIAVLAGVPGWRAALQLDTGMNRLGIEACDLPAVTDEIAGRLDLVMSHMGCADDPDNPISERQRRTFDAMTATAPLAGLPRSLSATAGTLLGPAYRYDMTRIGIGLYGGWPFGAGQGAVRLEVPVIQVRELRPGESVGYGAMWQAVRPSRIATIAAGYADGVIRAAGARGRAWIGGRAVPVAGRVSMDLITLDVTDVPCAPGDMAELLGPHQGIDALAEAAGTIGHEVLTSLGHRYRRVHVGG